ncbi:CesT family type III secretion system chaperone [Pseudovibrio sp. Tun.PSC04-5.I4]|uniref:CesT family type III secretion system chaperone n=1 Tax=Pseudovibrio sp. Tun.PSC04-5.I4 TaxID=1798213 RepID=UPI000891A8FC|nr:CesT family type III secretion system chaperone [Pseudovibrio sp. Tun.PSC04-5.I4]SDR22374.1 Tir chaperone protein (CesT) family protein [Pseudovibrio sp. Tun.PSC04-5.I4]
MRGLADELFNEIGKRIGLDGLSLDEENKLLLGLEQELFMSVLWREQTETLLFNSVVSKKPCRDAQVLHALMQANCVLTEGRGMSFNLDPATDHVNLSLIVSISDKSSFVLQEKLDLFISTAVAWHERLQRSEPLELDWGHSTPTPCEDHSEIMGLRL